MKKLRLFANNFVNTTTFKRVIFATVLFGILTYIIDYSPIGVAGLLKVTGGANILDFEKSYPLDKAYRMLDALGQAGRDFHLKLIMPVDIFFPIGFMLFNCSLMSIFLKYLTKDNSPLRLLPYLAVINMLCDWGENIGIVAMLIKFPKKLPTVCAISSTITSIKFGFVLLIISTIVILLICTLCKWIHSFIQSR